MYTIDWIKLSEIIAVAMISMCFGLIPISLSAYFAFQLEKWKLAKQDKKSELKTEQILLELNSKLDEVKTAQTSKTREELTRGVNNPELIQFLEQAQKNSTDRPVLR